MIFSWPRDSDSRTVEVFLSTNDFTNRDQERFVTSFWLGHCYDNAFCQQSQWFLALLLMLTIAVGLTNGICLYQISSSGKKLGCHYCMMQLVYVIASLMAVGGLLAYVSTEFKRQLQESSPVVETFEPPVVSLARVWPESSFMP